MHKRFHLALPCVDTGETSKFYKEVLGVTLGRRTDHWVDVNLFGNQITFTQAGNFKFDFKDYRLGDHVLPSFHFGIILETEPWGKLYKHLFKDQNLEVTTEVSFMENKVGEHISFFIKDPNGYTIEFKNFKDETELFSTKPRS